MIQCDSRLTAGLRLPHYLIVEQIYESASSWICRAVRRQDSKQIILKIMKPDFLKPEEWLGYRRDYEISRCLDAAGGLRAYDLEFYDPSPVLIQEDFKGRSLTRWMEEQKRAGASPFPYPQCFKLAIPIGRQEPLELLALPKNRSPFPVEIRLRFTGKDKKNCILVVQDISKRKKTEQALRDSQALYHDLVETSQDLIWQCDAEGRYTYLNPAWEDAFGYKVEEMLGKPFTRFQPPVEGERDRTLFLRLLEGGSVKGYETVHLRKDGTPIHLVFNAKRILGQDGTCLGTRGTAHDITERNRAEEALSNEKQRFQFLSENAPFGLARIDQEGGFRYVNPKFKELFGYDLTDVPDGRTWFRKAFPDPEFRRHVVSQWKEDFKNFKPAEKMPRIFKVVCKEGTEKVIHFIPVQLETGEFLLSCEDITERKQAEEALLAAYDRLEKQTVELNTALSEIKALKEQLEAENIFFRQEIKTRHKFRQIIGQSDCLKYVLYRAEQVAPTDTTVLILGETGSGKELVASAIHDMSPRNDRPMIIVNCAALPVNLIESELFGREKGAFTGADASRIGRFEAANGSTLLLDEIGELPLKVQAKLLRVIQHHEFERLGSPQTIKVDLRIVATTNRNLDEEVRRGRFRQDLYYRLNVFPITVPPLRQRKEDIPLLVEAFIRKYSRKLGKSITAIHHEAMRALQEYPWPGNIRELESVIERAVILCPGPILQLKDQLEILAVASLSGPRTLEETEKNHILDILSQTRWRINGKKGAAEILGLHPNTLRSKMQKLGIFRPPK